ncbi:hypothetical protein D3C76_1144500 [compost metagenome]
MAAVGQAALERQQQALEAAAGFQLVEQFVTDHALRHAVDGAADDNRSRILDRQIPFQRGQRYRAVGAHKKTRAHGNAFGTIGQGRDQAAAVLEATGCDHGNRNRFDHLIEQ